jgi:hypothetical protein
MATSFAGVGGHIDAINGYELVVGTGGILLLDHGGR